MRLATALAAILTAAGIAGCGDGSHADSARHTHAPATSAAVVVKAGNSGSARLDRRPVNIAAVQLFHPLGEYTRYVRARLAQLRPQLAALDHMIDVGDLAAARSDWLTAHLTWLTIGQDDGAYGAFDELGGRIDGLSDGDIGGTHSRKFTGFHRVELDLFRQRNLTAARTDTANLRALVGSITSQTLSQDLSRSAASLDLWVLRCHEILEDALRDSLTQDDDYGSNTDLANVRADVTATREMLNVLASLIAVRAPGLVKRGHAELKAIDAAVAAAHPPSSAWREPSALAARSRQRLNATVGAALETLAPVSELMQVTSANA